MKNSWRLPLNPVISLHGEDKMIFDDVEIDVDRFEVRRAGKPVSVEPKVFDLVRFLAENPNRLITKDELIEQIWAGRIVSDASLSTAIKSARRALGDTVDASRIKTVRGRGFRFEATETAQPKLQASGFVPPTFAVLPPRGDAGQIDAAVLQQRILASMARLPFLKIVAPAVTRALADATPKSVAATIGDGHALEINGRVDAAGRMFDCLLYQIETGEAVWVSAFGPFGDEADVEAVAGAISVQLEPRLLRALQGGLADSSDPRALTLRAMGTMALKGWNEAAFEEAEAGLRQALTKEPNLAYARAALALIMALGQRMGLSAPDENRIAEAVANAERAIDLDGHSPLVLGYSGCALVDVGQHLRGQSVLDRALSIDPMNVQAMASKGAAHLVKKDFPTAVEHLKRAISLCPNDSRLAIWRSALALAMLQMGDTEAALPEAKQAVAADDQAHLSRLVLATVCLTIGQTDTARDAWNDALRVTPTLGNEQIISVVGYRSGTALIKAFR